MRYFAVFLLLSGCSSLFRSSQEVATQRQVVVNAFLIAHGMALGYEHERDAKPETVLQLRALDEEAARAVHEMAQQPDMDPAAAGQKVAALAALVAE